mmetsp:Transcript_26510/g.37366  ORF Transcript_26510/g.37366 Transcript_26510/m.37366 type:complete len:471 (+) Transcript_26510:118-1530(+)
MAEFSKRPEVTVETMGKVHNPTGEGINAISAQAKATAAKHRAAVEKAAIEAAGSGPPGPQRHGHVHTAAEHETQVSEVGSARRNITRKKSDNTAGNYDNARKKQGGHGKGKWTEVMDGSEEAVVGALDENDPLYDEQEDSSKYILSSSTNNENLADKSNGDATGYDSIAEKAIYGPMLTLPEFKIRVADILREYFDSADTDEVIRSIDELKCKEYHPEVVKRAISLSLDEGPRERELVSRLLTCLHPTPLEEADVEAGFELLLTALDDLSIDIPDAKLMVGSFLARAVVDEVLPPAFLSTQNNDRPGDAVIERAVSLLSREHCTARLEHVWGPGDGRPVAELKSVMDMLLKEYLLSRELDEAAVCVKEMDAAHFQHELVKRGVTIAMEEDGQNQSEKASSAIDAMAALFSFLVKNAIVSEYQVAKGLSRLHKILPDLSLDVPAASKILEEFETLARDGGCLPAPSATPGQ